MLLPVILEADLLSEEIIEDSPTGVDRPDTDII
jgi:hypothetical protein